MELKTGLMGQMKDRQTNLWKRVQNDHLGDCGKYALLASQIARKAKFIDF
jgi:hypothetical protein